MPCNVLLCGAFALCCCAEIVTALLNLAEFMEHDDKRLPLDTRTLGALAEKCHAFAKVRLKHTHSRSSTLL
jgi:phosphatidylinositol kinase/protein kinase (PI-3  family)